jgi:hypothetical protein
MAGSGSHAAAFITGQPQTRLNLDFLRQAAAVLGNLVVAAWGKQIGNF